MTAERVGVALRDRAPGLGLVAVREATRFPGGLSSESYRLDVDTDDGPATWVLRREPRHGVIPPYDIGREHDLLAALHGAGLPVPEPLHVELDAAVLDGRFLVMSFVEGETYSSADERLSDPALAAVVRPGFVEMLVRIHRAPPAVREVLALPPGENSMLVELERCRRRLACIEVLPYPVIRHAFDVCEREAPPDEHLVLLHGDFRLPNLKWSGNAIVGVLDWELAAVGDPMSDLAFTQTVGAGPCAIEDDLAELYTELTGIPVDERRVAFYQLFQLAKTAVIGLGGASDLAAGGDDLRLLSVSALGLGAATAIPLLEAAFRAYVEA